MGESLNLDSFMGLGSPELIDYPFLLYCPIGKLCPRFLLW